MTPTEFQTFKNLRDKFDKEVEDLFFYIKKQYLDVLQYGRYSSYGRYGIDEDEICIEYYDNCYDLYETTDIYIPINDFLYSPFEWADNWANNIRAQRQKEKDKAIKEKEKYEKKELQRLKEKYEKKE